MPRPEVAIGSTRIGIAVFDDEQREAQRRLAVVSVECEGGRPCGIMPAGSDRDQSTNE